MRSRSPKLKTPSAQRSGLCQGNEGPGALRSLTDAYAVAAASRCMHLNWLGLCAIPEHVFTLVKLIRLDVGHNELTGLSSSVGLLVNLEQLWVNDNPLRSLPSELERCKNLKVIDARETALQELPTELGRLKNIVELDVRETPYSQSHDALETATLMKLLEYDDKKAQLRQDLIDKTSAGMYREVAVDCREKIRALASTIVNQFDNLEDLRDVVRNCDRLLPSDVKIVPTAAANSVRDRFRQLREDNDRKRLSAELELKLRAIYYDKIDPAKVEGYIADIYNSAGDQRLELEDVKFLVKNAPILFPKDDPTQIDGKAVRANVWALQAKLDQERAACVAQLTQVLIEQVYAHTEPHLVRDLATATCEQFKRNRFATKAELRDLKKLAADASLLFPPEFHNAKPAKVKHAFKTCQMPIPS